MENDSNVIILRDAVRKAPGVAQGTVVRFTMHQGRYTYTALWINRHWWLSGVWQAKHRFTNDEFVNDILVDAQDIEVATKWEEI